MAYDEYLAERIDRILQEKKVVYSSKKMMGGLCYLVDDKMCVGIVKDQLMARIGEQAQEQAMSREGVKEMNFTGRAMKGYVFVSGDGIDMEDDLAYFIQLALDFNPLAKASKKRKK